MKVTPELIQGFSSGVLQKHFDNPVTTPDCHKEWWDLCCSNNRFVAIAAPRGHAKSTAITFTYLLAVLLFRERSYALIVSDTETQAIQFLQDIKKILEDNQTLKDLFKIKVDGQGKTIFNKETESDIIAGFVDGRMFRIQAKGSEQKVRGLKWAGKRPDIIIGDDLENDEIVLNQDRREKFRRWVFGALLPCRADNGIIRFVGTILHLDSFLNRVMPEFQLQSINKKKELIEEPLKIYTDYRLPWKSVQYQAHDDPEYEHILWLEKWTSKGIETGRTAIEELKSEREKYVAQGLADVYSQEYLNKPIDEGNAYFKRADFRKMADDDRKRVFNYYVSADLAISEKQRSDYTAFTVGATDENGMVYIVHQIRARMDSAEIVNCILALEKAYKPLAFAIEEGAISKSIGPFLNTEMIRQNVFPNIILLTPTQDKLTRGQSMRARMRAGGVRFDMEADWFDSLMNEMLRFPRDRHDDQVDSISYLGLILDKLIEAPTMKEIAEDEYELFKRGDETYNDGRSEATGY